MQRSKRDKPVLGWREWVALPGLHIERTKAKVDTGARTSALHAFNVRPFRKDGEDWVRFEVHPLQRNEELERTCTCPALDYRWVTNSGGGREKRFVVETLIRLGEEEWPIEVTLTDRDQMGFRMLLGRSAIKNRFVVDPGRSFCMKSLVNRKERNRRLVKKKEAKSKGGRSNS